MREVDVVAVVCREEEIAQSFGVDLFDDVAQCPEVVQGVAHFFAIDFDHSDVHPIAREVAVLCAFGLGNFVFVVWEDQIASAAVDIERG